MTPFGFSPFSGSEDPEEMKKNIEAAFAQLGITPAGFLNQFSNGATELTLPENVAREIAKKFVTAHGFHPIGASDLREIREAMEIADTWLNEATEFPTNFTQNADGKNIYTRADWIDATIAGWQLTVEPLADGLAKAMSTVVDGQELPEGAPPIAAIAGMLRTFIGTLLATQLGQSIGALAVGVTGLHDVGLPLVQPSRPGLLPQNIDEWGSDIGVDLSQVRIFHALREGAVARLFDSNPWLIDYLRGAIGEYGNGVRIDVQQIQSQAQEAFESGAIDPNNPESFTIALNQGLFTPDESVEQKSALAKLETALALIDGWADDVVTLASNDRLPALNSLRETLRRRRATSSPTQQLFASLFGLEVSPRMAREASTFWSELRTMRDIHTRDHVWSGILPTQEELTDPASYLRSIEVPDDLSTLDQ